MRRRRRRRGHPPSARPRRLLPYGRGPAPAAPNLVLRLQDHLRDRVVRGELEGWEHLLVVVLGLARRRRRFGRVVPAGGDELQRRRKEHEVLGVAVHVHVREALFVRYGLVELRLEVRPSVEGRVELRVHVLGTTSLRGQPLLDDVRLVLFRVLVAVALRLVGVGVQAEDQRLVAYLAEHGVRDGDRGQTVRVSMKRREDVLVVLHHQQIAGGDRSIT
mmetsp:Transcript_25237/g.70859  ORF Transcript_25237/g.70859 Transcript_25237/m.70859 type:complete len:218 (+) Transcript_25237:40-693(+)